MNNQPYIILVKPQLAENIGMSARAMMNCGLEHLRLVSPREDHLSPKAVSASSGAEEILRNARIYATTQEAAADLQLVMATTARPRNQIKMVYTAAAAATELQQKLSADIRCGILFGPERTGLQNEDISLADSIIEIPLNPRHCSLNLAQAVLLVGYEWYKTQIHGASAKFVTNDTIPASRDSLLHFLEYLEKQLEQSGSFPLDEKRARMVINLRNIFTRNSLTEQEINTLYGVVNHLAGSK